MLEGTGHEMVKTVCPLFAHIIALHLNIKHTRAHTTHRQLIILPLAHARRIITVNTTLHNHALFVNTAKIECYV